MRRSLYSYSKHIPLPSSLKLLRKIKVSTNPDCVSYHQQSTYVGSRTKIVEQVGLESKEAVKLLELPYRANSVLIHNNFLYVLGHLDEEPWCILVFDLAGTLVRQWNYGSTTDSNLNKMCIVNGQIVVCNSR